MPVVLGTEFGRTPMLNDNGGLDYDTRTFTCLLAGAGSKGGKREGRPIIDALIASQRAQNSIHDPPHQRGYIAHKIKTNRAALAAPFVHLIGEKLNSDLCGHRRRRRRAALGAGLR